MAQECGFFNAELEGSEYDRVYNAEQFAAYFASFISNGVFGDSMGELVVLENQQANMSVDVSSGQGWINGWWYRNTEELNLPIALADGVLNRKDIVVLRWGNAERDMWLQVLQGEPSGKPIAPSIVRNADYYDLKLCEIDIPAGTSSITQSLITDTRLDNTVCGLVTGVVQQIDTTQLFIQFQAAYADWKNIQEADYESWTAEQQQDYNTWITTNQNAFITWFNHMKDQLDSDAAGHLQNEIDDLQVYVDEGFDNIELKRFVGENLAEAGTKEGSVLAHTIYGMAVQDGTPTPSVPVEIQSAKADFRCVGKNLIPYPSYQDGNRKTQNGITFTVNSDGTVTANGTATAATTYNCIIRLPSGVHKKFPNGSYHASGCPSGSSGIRMYFNHTVNGAPSNYLNDKGNGGTFTVNGDDFYDDGALIGVQIYISSGYTVNNLVFKPMITLADVEDSDYEHFEPYQHTDVTTDLTLRAIEVTSSDDYNLERDGKYYIADTIDWSEDRGYQITRRIKEIIYNGTESWITNVISGNRHMFFKNLSDNIPPKTQDDVVYAVSSHFSATSRNNIINNAVTNVFGQNASTLDIMFISSDTSITTIAQWKTWLESNNVIVDYILATPTTESITSEQAQALLSLKTYDEASYITSTSDVEPSIELEYAKSETGAKALTGHNEGYIAQELENVYGVKNLIPYPYADGASKTLNGITFTVNDDGSITANGTATANTRFYLTIYNGNFDVDHSMTYILSDGIDADDNTFFTSCALYNGATYINTTYDTDIGNGEVLIDFSNVSREWDNLSIYIIIKSGVTVNNLTFKPMLRLASIQSNEYQPYAMSNHELTNNVRELNSNKQNATDNTLNTTSKNVVGAINELKNNIDNALKLITVTISNISVPAGNNGYLEVTDVILTNLLPSGKIPIAVAGFHIWGAYAQFAYMYRSKILYYNGAYRYGCSLRNTYPSTIPIDKIEVYILCR